MGEINRDGLYMKYGVEEAAIARGGEYVEGEGSDLVFEFAINGSDVRTLTSSMNSTSVAGILGEQAGTEIGSFGVVLPRGLRIKEVEVFTETAFTASAGAIGSASLVLGLKREDRVTELDHDGLLTSAFVGTFIDGLGETTTVRVGSTGAGALIGTTLAQDGIVVVSNATHGTNTIANGRAIVRVRGYFPYPSA